MIDLTILEAVIFSFLPICEFLPFVTVRSAKINLLKPKKGMSYL